jgi:hypothetical protein
MSKDICPSCNGTGSVVGEAYTASTHDGVLRLEQALESCDACHATGKLRFDLKEVEILSFSGVDHSDHPDYSDAFIEEALYRGKEMTEDQIDLLQDKHDDFVYDQLMAYMF